MTTQHPSCATCALCFVERVFCRREGRGTSLVAGCRAWTPADPSQGIPYPDGSFVKVFPIHPVFCRDVSQKSFTKQSGFLVTPGQTPMGGNFHFKTRLSLTPAGRIQEVKTL